MKARVVVDDRGADGATLRLEVKSLGSDWQGSGEWFVPAWPPIQIAVRKMLFAGQIGEIDVICGGSLPSWLS